MCLLLEYFVHLLTFFSSSLITFASTTVQNGLELFWNTIMLPSSSYIFIIVNNNNNIFFNVF